MVNLKFWKTNKFFDKKEKELKKIKKVKKNINNLILKKLGIQYVFKFFIDFWNILKKPIKIVLNVVFDGLVLYIALEWLKSPVWYLKVLSLGTMAFLIVYVYVNYIINWKLLRRNN